MEQQTIVLKSSIAGSEELLRRTIAIPKAGISLADFKAIVEGIHRLNQPFSLSWTDDDQDTIAILTDEDVAEALGTTLSLPKPVLRLSLKPANRIPRGNCRGMVRMPHGGMKRSLVNLTGMSMEEAAPLIDAAVKGDSEAQQWIESSLQSVVVDNQRGFLGWPKSKQALAQLTALTKGKVQAPSGPCGMFNNFLRRGMRQHQQQQGCKKKLSMKFVADQSLPDGTELFPGKTVSKTWKVVNNGTEPWPADLQLQHVGQSIFENSLPSTVPALEPGQETELSLNEMVAPTTPGRYISHWRLSTTDGYRFGDRLWFDVNVTDQDGNIVAPPAPPTVHLGIVCDATGMNPIVGARYKKLGVDYDLCEEAFDALTPEAQGAFKRIMTQEDAADVAQLEQSMRQQAHSEPEPQPQPEREPEPEPEPEAVSEFKPQVAALVAMGFSAGVAEAKVAAANGNIDAALEAALLDETACHAPAAAAWEPEWDTLVEELNEMGFGDNDANKAAVRANNGDLKQTVTALVAQERAVQA